MSPARPAAGLLVAVVAWLGLLPALARAACDADGSDAADVAAARAAIAAACNCATAASHGAYVSCAAVKARTVLANPACLGAVVRCAARSTCGRPGAAVCCRTRSSGQTRARLVRRPAACRAPAGGSACVGTLASVCDACLPGGCVTTTTATTTTSTTTTTLPPVCGNGIVEPGEACDGPQACLEFFGDCLGCMTCCFVTFCSLSSADIPCCSGFPCAPGPGLPPGTGFCPL
jgi:hypothetical protein